MAEPLQDRTLLQGDLQDEEPLDIEEAFREVIAETRPLDTSIPPGNTTLYHTITGEAIEVKNTQVRPVLSKRHSNPNYPELFRKPVFTRRPTKKFISGTIKCLLHPDRPERAEFDRQGFPACLTSHIYSEYELRRHMQFRHKGSWESIQFETEQDTRRRSELLQQRQLEAMQALSEGRESSRTQRTKKRKPEHSGP